MHEKNLFKEKEIPLLILIKAEIENVGINLSKLMQENEEDRDWFLEKLMETTQQINAIQSSRPIYNLTSGVSERMISTLMDPNKLTDDIERRIASLQYEQAGDKQPIEGIFSRADHYQKALAILEQIRATTHRDLENIELLKRKCLRSRIDIGVHMLSELIQQRKQVKINSIAMEEKKQIALTYCLSGLEKSEALLKTVIHPELRTRLIFDHLTAASLLMSAYRQWRELEKLEEIENSFLTFCADYKNEIYESQKGIEPDLTDLQGEQIRLSTIVEETMMRQINFYKKMADLRYFKEERLKESSISATSGIKSKITNDIKHLRYEILYYYSKARYLLNYAPSLPVSIRNGILEAFASTKQYQLKLLANQKSLTVEQCHAIVQVYLEIFKAIHEIKTMPLANAQYHKVNKENGNPSAEISKSAKICLITQKMFQRFMVFSKQMIDAYSHSQQREKQEMVAFAKEAIILVQKIIQEINTNTIISNNRLTTFAKEETKQDEQDKLDGERKEVSEYKLENR